QSESLERKENSQRTSSEPRWRVLLAEETCLRSWPAEGAVAFRHAFVGTIESKPFAMDLEQTLRGRPVFPLPPHSFAEFTGIHFASARFKDTTDYPISLGWQFFAQTLFKIRRDAARQSQHVDEGECRPSLFCTLQKDRQFTA